MVSLRIQHIVVGAVLLMMFGCATSEKKAPEPKMAGMENTFRARVDRVIDVNTIVVSANGMDETVRLAGIKKTGYELPSEKRDLYKKQCAQLNVDGTNNTFCATDSIRGPGKDLKHFTREVQVYRGKKAKQFTEQMVRNERVLVYSLEPTRDAEKNLLALVYRESDQLFVNYAIIRMGYGLVTETPQFEHLASFQTAEQAAQSEKLGLWGAPLPEDEKIVVKAASPSILSEDYIVYISNQDRRYHLEHCQKLDETRYPVQLKDAKKGKYRPCPVCCPGK